MKFQVLVIFLLSVYISSIYAENVETDLENSTPLDTTRPSHFSKIHPTLINWQTSENPDEFAKTNNLSYKENKIAVYIHLENVESRSKIPPEINVTAFDEKIAIAFVSTEQLDQLANLDFVKRITPPDRVRIPPLPQIEQPTTQTPEEGRYDYFVWIVIGGIVIFTTIVIFKKRRKIIG